jgi:hypothetical protein
MSRKHQKTAIFLPYGKAEYTPSPLLPKIRRSLLQPHPWTPGIWDILGFCNVRVKTANNGMEDRNIFGRGQLCFSFCGKKETEVSKSVAGL